MENNKNPLLENYGTAYETVPFEVLKPEHFNEAYTVIAKRAKTKIDCVIKSKSQASFENTIVPIEEAVSELSHLGLILFNLNSAATNKEIQLISENISPMITRFMSKLLISRSLFKRVDFIYHNIGNEDLSSEEKWLLETTWHSMKRNGANLSFFKKYWLVRIQMRLSGLTLRFNNNVLAETNNFELHLTSENDLEGLHPDYIAAAAAAANEKGKPGWLFTLHHPSYVPFMKYSGKRHLREFMYRAYSSRCNKNDNYSNRHLIKKICNLRLKQAMLTGFKNYAEYVLDERMAKTPHKVFGFMEHLHKASMPYAKADLAELIQKIRSEGFNEELMPWDFAYYTEKLKFEKFGYDENMLKPYFRLENVIDAIFDLSEKLFGIQVQPDNSIQVYHPDVKTYKVCSQNGEYLAVLYADFFPRENKQGGAWMTEYKQQSNINGKMVRPHISICCNFTKPNGDCSSLLTFSEVHTFLHEFGHALHGMLANTTYPSISGTNVFRDFVELPSQILENWLFEIEWLQQFARHYKTGEPIPVALVNKLIDARNFQSGYQSLRQLAFGFLDMAWHTINRPFGGDVNKFEQENIAKTLLLPIVEGSSISTSFTHIFGGGYAAGYYGYKWAEVLDADAFSVFRENGIFDPETANKFRTEILEKGGSANPMHLYKNFRGKEPSIDALLVRSGLKPANIE